jgi:hypothetical protein
MGMPLDEQLATLYGQFVEAVYEMFASDESSLTPAPQGIPPGFNLVAWINMSDFTATTAEPMFYGFIAQDQAHPQSFVLAIRGTQNWTEWWDNLRCALVPFNQVPNSGSVALGFDEIYKTLVVVDAPAKPQVTGTAAEPARSAARATSFAEQVARAVRKRARSPKPNTRDSSGESIAVTGHSLGAALATLYVLENTSKGIISTPTLCTFGSPRVGDEAFTRAFNALNVTSWRIANVPDVVPNLPPESFGYDHVDTLTLVNSTGQVKSTITCAHALATYLVMLDSTLRPDRDCEPQASDIRMRDRRIN